MVPLKEETPNQIFSELLVAERALKGISGAKANRGDQRRVVSELRHTLPVGRVAIVVC